MHTHTHIKTDWCSQKILIGEADFGIVLICCGDCYIRVSRSCCTSFLLSGGARTLTSVSLTNFKCSMHQTGPMLAF